MQFIVIARDDKKDGPRKRLAAREEHIKLGDSLQAEGRHLVSAAILDENDEMRGSVLIVDFPSRQELDGWLAQEPYVVNKVWQDIEILPCRIGPSFTKLFEKKVLS